MTEGSGDPAGRISRRGAIAWLAATFAAVARAPQAIAGPPADGVGSPQVAVAGAVTKPMTFSVDELRGLPTQVSTTLTRRGEPGEAESTSSVKGVPLAALVKQAGLVEPDRNSWKHTVVVVSATDGYAVAFSWPELVNTDVGAGVLVIYERDGKPLDNREGPIALVSAQDQRTGPRHVRWVQRIEVTIAGR